tara:strand:+ start:649 stop:840 length:192 start_codon:yes stop_codon:yes gene_type:complete
MTKQKFLANSKFNLLKTQQESFFAAVNKAMRASDAGRHEEAEKFAAQADALWRKVKKVHGVEL